jgi:hypothetical protein
LSKSTLKSPPIQESLMIQVNSHHSDSSLFQQVNKRQQCCWSLPVNSFSETNVLRDSMR